jgi:hypothetical protein
MRYALLVALAAASQIGSMCGAHASEQTARIELHGYVPVICRADFEASSSLTGNAWHLGAIHEFCNAGTGYQVVVEYEPTADPGSLLLDGRLIPLDASGHMVIQQVYGPAIQTSLLGYVPGNRPISNLHISLQTKLI